MGSKILAFCLILLAVDVFTFADKQNKIESKILSRRKRFVIFPTGSSFSVAVCMTIGGETAIFILNLIKKSSFSVYGNPQFSIFSWALNYGFAYNLPSNSSYFLHPPEGILDFPFFKDETTTTTTSTAAPEQTVINENDHVHDPSSRRQYLNQNQPQFETKPMMQRRYRREIYRNIESVIDKMGYHGKNCVLQALCESSQIFKTQQNTMVEELIKTVFSFPKSKVLPFEHPELLIYDEAHRKGQNQVDCDNNWRCGFSLIDMALGKYSENKLQNSFM